MDLNILLQNHQTIIAFVQVFAKLIGVIFAISGIFALATHTREPHKNHLRFAFVSIFMGALAWSLDKSADTVTSSILTDPSASNMLDFSSAGSEMAAQLGAIQTFLLSFLALVGYVSFLRGLMILRESSRAKPVGGSTVAKGVTHLIGGVVAIHLLMFGQLLSQLINYKLFF